ncbi:cephalosporin hydroxylase family protein [Paenibacillus cymbidii]|uniref:cephalosporin hydroxylase family protein n=1 Tax=Paenibacillus cymbidii TaxID=1639034 RepID=UPI001080E5ED|nr:cephalosporin hydroxylase family protein [Paenibacillus cymbidii]
MTSDDRAFHQLTSEWFQESCKRKYSYRFSWLGRPIIQYPQDVMAMQEIVWKVRPDLIVETGIAHGGSLIFHASLLELMGGDGQVIGIDIDIRQHNRAEIERHPMFKRIRLLEGSSTDPAVVQRIYDAAKGKERALVILDSHHTHAHVLQEMQLYSPLVGPGSYLIVMDTVVEHLPKAMFPDRPWGPGDNPKTAVHQFLRTNKRFVIDDEMNRKLMITAAPDGYLKCVEE